MKAIPFPQANKVLRAPPSRRSEIQEQLDALRDGGADVVELQAKLDAVFPPEKEDYDLSVWGGQVEGIERCISCWEPSPEERALIAAGGPVWLWVVGRTHPPLVLDAANPFEPAEAQPPRAVAEIIADELMEEAGDMGQGAPASDLTKRLEGWARRLRGES